MHNAVCIIIGLLQLIIQLPILVSVKWWLLYSITVHGSINVNELLHNLQVHGMLVLMPKTKSVAKLMQNGVLFVIIVCAVPEVEYHGRVIDGLNSLCLAAQLGPATSSCCCFTCTHTQIKTRLMHGAWIFYPLPTLHVWQPDSQQENAWPLKWWSEHEGKRKERKDEKKKEKEGKRGGKKGPNAEIKHATSYSAAHVTTIKLSPPGLIACTI